MDYIALTGVNFFLKRRKRLLRLFTVALLGSFLSLLIQINIRDAGIRMIVLHFIVNTGMTAFAFGFPGKKGFLENWSFVYLTILFLGGFMEWEENIGFPASFFWLKAAIAAGVLSVATVYLMQKKNFTNLLYEVEVRNGENRMTLHAYLDSGNLLVDPYIKEPVHLMTKSKALELLENKNEPIRLIPYRSLGNENGLLPVCSIEEMVIKQEKGTLRIKPAVIGMATDELLRGMEYDMILQATVLERGSYVSLNVPYDISHQKGEHYEYEVNSSKV